MAPHPPLGLNLEGAQVFVCRIDDPPDLGPPVPEAAIAKLAGDYSGIRSLLISAYEIPRAFWNAEGLSFILPGSAPQRIRDLGALLWYGTTEHTGKGKRKVPINIEEMVKKLHALFVQLCVGHDKDAVDKAEAAIEECLAPLLSAPVKQLRKVAAELLVSLKSDKTVPFLVWRAYEIWAERMQDAPDEDVRELKTELAGEIVKLVDGPDLREQLPEAMMRALQWRSPQALEQMKTVVEKEQKEGRGVKIRGKESCLFLVAAEGTPEEVCVQL